MPVISMFYGMIVLMEFSKERKKNVPLITVKYQDQEAVFSISNGNLIQGKLKIGKTYLIKAWIEIHREDLFADWELAKKGQTVFPIEPLR